MTKKNLISHSVILIGIIQLIVSCSATIDTTKYQTPTFYEKVPTTENHAELSLSMVETGYATTLEAFVFRGGKIFKKRKLSHIAIVIRHPKGTFAFDTGLGNEIENQFHDSFNFLDRQIFKFNKLHSLRETLIKNKFEPDSIRFIIPSHLHFDHASGIEDFPKASVWTTLEEYQHAMSEEATPPAFIKQQYDEKSIQWNFIEFKPVPYEIFEESYDVFNDGTVVLVKMPGHTTGSIGMFVTLKSGKKFFFTGDTTWAREAFINPSEKHRIPRNKVDFNREAVKECIVKIHYLMKRKPELIVVPAHDFNAQKDIAKFPNFEQ